VGRKLSRRRPATEDFFQLTEPGQALYCRFVCNICTSHRSFSRLTPKIVSRGRKFLPMPPPDGVLAGSCGPVPLTEDPGRHERESSMAIGNRIPTRGPARGKRPERQNWSAGILGSLDSTETPHAGDPT